MAFYRVFDHGLVEAPNFVYGPGYELLIANYQSYAYPVYDWYWFDTREEAEIFFDQQVIE